MYVLQLLSFSFLKAERRFSGAWISIITYVIEVIIEFWEEKDALDV